MLSFIFLLQFLVVSNAFKKPISGSGNVERRGRSSDDKPLLTGTKPDPWVSAAPLIVAAVCCNGVALVAIHPTTADIDENATDNKISHDVTITTPELDWTETYRDVVRIHPIDNEGTALLCCGWRTDGQWLAQTCRSITRDEMSTYGSTPSFLAEEVSLWMAHCTASDTVRPLSVVGLLASTCANTGTHNDIGPYLHLVDATGAYRVRAHAVGRGAKTINTRLRPIRFETMTAEEGMDRLLQVLSIQEGEDGDSDWHPFSNSTRVELAIADAEKKSLRRIRQPFLVPKALLNKV